MLSYLAWLDESKKKGKKQSSPPTTTSSPIRGPNQDQSGFSPTRNVADYTISDA